MGRPRIRLRNSDLINVVKVLFGEKNIYGFSSKVLVHAKQILEYDIRLDGRVFKVKCRVHGKQDLSYRFQFGAGIKIFCEVEGCHFATKRRDKVWKH